MQFAGKGKSVIICNKCHKTIRIKPRYKIVDGIEYSYFACKKCGETYVISATDEALRQDIEKYREMAEKAHKGDITEEGRQEMQELLQANMARSRELKREYPFNIERKGSAQ